MAETPEPTFEFQCPILGDAAPQVLGLWKAVAVQSSDRVTFDSTSAMTLQATVWRVGLSGEPSLAAIQLSNGKARLEASQSALATILGTVNVLARNQLARGAFDLGGEDTSGRPEKEVLLLLREIQENSAQATSARAKTFAVGEEPTQQFHAFVDRVVQLFTQYACVESHTEGRLWARTIVGWTGSMETIWQPGVLPAEATLHKRVLALALASRNSLIRTFVIAAQTAVKLSLLASVPGGVILMLPLAWSFVNRVLAERKEAQVITKALSQTSQPHKCKPS